MTRQNSTMFGMESIEDYLAFCAQAVTEFEQDQANVLRAFAATLALNHIPDWLRYKLTSTERGAIGLPVTQAGECVQRHFEDQNDDLKRLRDIANGFKHLRPTHSTDVVAGYGTGPYGVGPYGAPYLLIDLGEHLPPQERWDVGLSLCKRTLVWWQTQLSTLMTTSRGI